MREEVRDQEPGNSSQKENGHDCSPLLFVSRSAGLWNDRKSSFLLLRVGDGFVFDHALLANFLVYQD